MPSLMRLIASLQVTTVLGKPEPEEFDTSILWRLICPQNDTYRSEIPFSVVLADDNIKCEALTLLRILMTLQVVMVQTIHE